MGICSTLSAIQKNYVDFDPTNKDHLEAFRMLCLGTIEHRPGGIGHSRQHPTLRFNLEQPFRDVRTMMFHKVSEAYLNSFSTVE